MGLLSRLFGREREEERDAFGHPKADVAFESPPTEGTWTSVTVNGRPVAPEQAQAFAAAFEGLGNLAALGEAQSHVIDLRDVPGLRDRVLGAVSQAPTDPAALQAVITDVLRTAQEQGKLR